MEIFIANLAKYNSGIICGQWFDLEDYLEKEDLVAAVYDMLSEQSKKDGVKYEEWLICDYDDIPFEVGSYEDFGTLFEVKNAIVKFGESVVTAAMQEGIPLEKIEDAYYGCFESEKDFVMQFVEDMGTFEDVPELIKTYFDYESCCRDLMMSDFSSVTLKDGVHVFSHLF